MEEDPTCSYACPIKEEPLADYRRGGYHPVQFGDRFHFGKYEVIDKLGWGPTSTVWLARETEQSRWVALKIFKSSNCEFASRVTQILTDLARQRNNANDSYGCQNIMSMYSFFDHTGPNGRHQCHIYELLGHSVEEFVMDQKYMRLNREEAWTTCKQALHGLMFMHEADVAHGAIQSSALLLQLANMDHLSTERMIRWLRRPDPLRPIHTAKVTLKFGRSRHSDSVPTYIVTSIKRFPCRIGAPQGALKWKWSCFGSSFSNLGGSFPLRTPLRVAAPEYVFKEPVDNRVDLWAVGALIFELYFGQKLFYKTDSVDEIALQWHKTLGPLPEHFLSQCDLQRGMELNLIRFSYGEEVDLIPENTTMCKPLRQWMEDLVFNDAYNNGAPVAYTKDKLDAFEEILRFCLKFQRRRSDAFTMANCIDICGPPSTEEILAGDNKWICATPMGEFIADSVKRGIAAQSIQAEQHKNGNANEHMNGNGEADKDGTESSVPEESLNGRERARRRDGERRNTFTNSMTRWMDHVNEDEAGTEDSMTNSRVNRQDEHATNGSVVDDKLWEDRPIDTESGRAHHAMLAMMEDLGIEQEVGDRTFEEIYADARRRKPERWRYHGVDTNGKEHYSAIFSRRRARANGERYVPNGRVNGEEENVTEGSVVNGQVNGEDENGTNVSVVGQPKRDEQLTNRPSSTERLRHWQNTPEGSVEDDEVHDSDYYILNGSVSNDGRLARFLRNM